MTADDSDQDDREESPLPVDQSARTAASSSYKVLGEDALASGTGVLGRNTAGSGTPIGVEGAVPNSSQGYGLSTPDDARVGGALEADTITDAGSGFVSFGSTPEITGIETGNSDFVVSVGLAGAYNVVHGHGENTVKDGAVGATIGGGGGSGDPNVVTDDFGTIGGGENNTATSGSHGTVSGGTSNTVKGQYATVGGGLANSASAAGATVGGGGGNEATASNATVAGGGGNEATVRNATVGGGGGNTASGKRATVGGGINNTAGDKDATVGGGGDNTASGQWSTVAGGSDNTATSGREGTVSGGTSNTAKAERATVGGGGINTARASASTVGGGQYNTATTSSTFGTISGGSSNAIKTYRATVGGGQGNVASGDSATVAGGVGNIASGRHATIPGGRDGEAADTDAFVWNDNASYHDTDSDGTDDGLSSSKAVAGEPVTGNRTFTVSAQGGVRFITGSNSVTYIEGGTTGWASTSTRAAKTNVDPVDPEEILDGVTEMEVATWEYRDGDGDGRGVRHVGPMAEDFHQVVDVGTSDDHINSVNADGVAFAAIQGLARRLERKDDRIAEQSDRVDVLERERDRLHDRVDVLERERDRLHERLAALEAQVGADPTPADD